MVRLIFLVFWSSAAFSNELCDVLGSLEADPYAVSNAVSFQEIKGDELVKACSAVIAKQDENLPRYLLQRGRGYLRIGQGASALADIIKAHELGYPAATFGLGTAYYLGDDIKQDFDVAQQLFNSAYSQRVRWAAQALSLLYGNENYEGYDPHLSEVWSARFKYTIPVNVVAKPELIDRVLDDYQHQCNDMVLADVDAFDVPLPAKLWMDEGNFYDIHIDKSGKLATVFYGAIGCSEYGYAWSGSGGSRYFLFVDDEIYHGWGGAPYSIEYERGFHVILPRSGSACDTSDDMLLANADVCHGVANWDEALHVFNSIGNQLPIWEPDI